MTKISILVAVYNAEKYLRTCIDSLLAQALHEIQVICIDDCSTDSSLEILRSYEQKDERVTVVHLSDNRGQAHARNQGLLHAKGEYICFVDSDDWLSPDALQKALEVFENNPTSDSVLFRCVMVDEKTGLRTNYAMEHFDVKSGQEAFVDSLSWKIHGIYMIRTQIHLMHPYDESLKSFSDDNTTRIHYFYSREVRMCDGVYYYLQRDKSASHIVDASRANYVKACEIMRQNLIQMACDRKIKDLYEKQYWLTIVDLYYFYFSNHLSLGYKGRTEVLSTIHRAWNNVDMTSVKRNDPVLVGKFGYRHENSWLMFRLQEELYFLIRQMLGKNRK